MTLPHPVRCDKSPLGTSTLRVGALAIQRLAGDLSGARLESRGLPHWLSISPLLASRWRSLIRSKRSCNNFTIPPVPPVVASYRQTNRPKIATTTTAMKRSMIMCNPRYRHIMMTRARLHRNRYASSRLRFLLLQWLALTYRGFVLPTTVADAGDRAVSVCVTARGLRELGRATSAAGSIGLSLRKSPLPILRRELSIPAGS